jgi:hypothetical protein
MSTVLMRREIPPVCFEARVCGIEFANASADVQKQFLLGWVAATRDWRESSWPFQCRYIIDEMDREERAAVADVVSSLLDHLTEPVQ